MPHSLKTYQDKSHTTGYKFKSVRVHKEQDNFTLSYRKNKVLYLLKIEQL
jgi:hypothetical protein